MWKYVKFLVMLIVLVAFLIPALPAKQTPHKAKGSCCYNPPGNVQQPLGDEEMNTNILGKPAINEMKEKKPQRQYKGTQCPAIAFSAITDPYLMCHKRGEKDFSEVLFGSNTNPTPKLQCKKCSLNITEDGRAVVLQCFECFEFDDDKQRILDREILYLVNFIEIFNYDNMEFFVKQEKPKNQTKSR